MLSDAYDIASYIVANYQKARKIVEIGIGKLPVIAIEIKKRLPTTLLLVVDINPITLEDIARKYPELVTVIDDVFNPDLSVYHDANLIYSIRPPAEMLPPLLKIAKQVKTDLIIRPTADESPYDFKEFKLVNYGMATLYHYFAKRE
ncbi:hypothetical protein KEJ26_00450 [Candidatus Bathyarchaeota archaeon]|nr:hypothetical protein [Candidatus Bathyarchaeota archaeon]